MGVDGTARELRPSRSATYRPLPLAARSDLRWSVNQDQPSWASNEAVRASMKANRSRDTAPELALRRAVHALGMRYRVAARPLPTVRRTADLVFARARVAVFLDGCFWHGCPEHHTVAVRNGQYWADKVARNKARDADTDQRLRDAGWEPIRVWEHEDVLLAAERVRSVVLSRKHPPSR
ncbi:very short patch repair endonuclease [Streptomyces sp. SID14515]|uniref:DNA mismatch endonuclease Vsr n=1 Tax=Streptomyces TaxID=1883 RepID=UPI0013CA879C|nr:very short patch repair endonuclease [Streptomyces sp. SID14515]